MIAEVRFLLARGEPADGDETFVGEFELVPVGALSHRAGEAGGLVVLREGCGASAAEVLAAGVTVEALRPATLGRFG